MNSFFLIGILLHLANLQVSKSASVRLHIDRDNQDFPERKYADNGTSTEPVWSYGESNATASATGAQSTVQTNSWHTTESNGGLQVTNITSDGNVIGYQASGMTNCSQESWALAMGSLSANAVAEGLCISSVLLDQPLSNTGPVNQTKTE
ncbi:unnamed protein product [Orchesella dallaii]|uniref:Uncharacterized protein n=1 Tax=Orchesella dallaii TaxID=48710 RepID=A0ABP1R7H6_9HEXA